MNIPKEQKQTQKEYLYEKILKKIDASNLSPDKKDEKLKEVNKIVECIRKIYHNIDKKDQTLHSGNIIPYWRKFDRKTIEYELEAGNYHRKYECYADSLDICNEAISIYIKNQEIQCDELTSTLLELYFLLKVRYITNHFGFKFIPWINGWRYNLWGYITGSYEWSWFLGTITSGFILFPLLIYILINQYNQEGIVTILTLLLTYKIIKFIFRWILSCFGIRSKQTKKIFAYFNCYDYIIQNSTVLQPSKLKELCSPIDDLSAPVSILISQIQSDCDYLSGNTEFVLLYNPDINKT